MVHILKHFCCSRQSYHPSAFCTSYCSETSCSSAETFRLETHTQLANLKTNPQKGAFL